ncbi:hypothetical protein MUO65_06960 [bacterium]|nr:hypothetical protein [bacterium]
MATFTLQDHKTPNIATNSVLLKISLALRNWHDYAQQAKNEADKKTPRRESSKIEGNFYVIF